MQAGMGGLVVNGAWSRRGLFALVAASSLAGCAEDPARVIASDPNLGILVKDPMYLWNPDGDLKRTEALQPKSDSKLASGSLISKISVEFRFRTSGDVSALLAEAKLASSQAGYVNGSHMLADREVDCYIDALPDGTGISLLLVTLGLRHSGVAVSADGQDPFLARAIVDNWAAMRLSEPCAACW